MAEVICGRYVVVRQIGEGGMATVYLCVDQILKREVAVKVLRGDMANDEIALKRFKREALAITSTSHPNIVEVYDVGNDEQRNYIVMEYVHGKTLKQLVRQRGVLSCEEAVNIMKQLVSATANAHKQQIIHRDIKSQNVLIKDDGTVKLSDFGIASSAEQKQGLTKTSTVMGSVHYLAPELAGGKPASYQSDIYSLGIVLYEMLTGDVPYKGETAVEIALKHMHNDIPSVKDFDPTIPQAVENIVIKACSRDPKFRYKTANEMFDDISTCLDLSRMNEEKRLLEDLAFEYEAKQKELNKEKTKTTARKTEKVRKGKLSIDNILSIIMITLLTLVISIILYLITHPAEKLIEIPLVYNQPYQSVVELLENKGLVIDNITYQSTDDLEKGAVISISPEEGSKVKEGSLITIVVSSGTNYYINDYVGRDITEAEAILNREGFEVIVNYVENTSKPAGTILWQSIAAGNPVSPTDIKRITFEVATYVSFVIPPSIKGMKIEEAKKQLEKLGAIVFLQQLTIEDNIDANGNYIHPQGVVISTTPDINTSYRQSPGAYITIYYY